MVRGLSHGGLEQGVVHQDVVTDPRHFITYWADAVTGLPVRYQFFDGATFDVIVWEEGKTPPDEYWQAPPNCFHEQA